MKQSALLFTFPTKILVFACLFFSLSFFYFVSSSVKVEAGEVCPGERLVPKDGWLKFEIDKGDSQPYTVDGATQYCYKAGNDNSHGCNGGIFSSIPDGGFGNNGYCALSHWSYYIPGPSLTPVPCNCTPTPSPIPTPEVTPSPVPTPTPSPSCSPSPIPTPTVSPTPVFLPLQPLR